MEHIKREYETVVLRLIPEEKKVLTIAKSRLQKYYSMKKCTWEMYLCLISQIVDDMVKSGLPTQLPKKGDTI